LLSLGLIAAYVFALSCISHAQTFNPLLSFSGPNDGTYPAGALTRASDGNFYGTTSGGGAYSEGTVFKITTAGALTTLYSFTGGMDGAGPQAGLIQAGDGHLYGTTTYGGASPGYSGVGTAFRITTDGTLTTLHRFTGGTDGGSPRAGLIQARDGSLYGTTAGDLYGGNDLGTVFRITTGGKLKTLWNFTGGSDGANPTAPLVQARNGNLYGTTYEGGLNGDGAVFKITTGGKLTTLWSFTNGADGGYPYAGLTQANDGNFYGTTTRGGANGSGTVYRITSGGALATLYSFSATNLAGINADGASPQAGLLQASDGNLYGTTTSGGLYAGSDGFGDGTVFKITTGGTLTTLYSFTGGTDGAGPSASLIQGADGNLYATTALGGVNGWGTVFRITTGGTLTTLYSFSGGTDGTNPVAGLIQASDGNLYGTTLAGGAYNDGTVFQITTAGALTTLYSFTGGTDGVQPAARLVQASDGNLYGTTEGNVGRGGAQHGTIFKITTEGTLTTLYSFTGGTDGAYPLAGLIQASDGNLYGTTSGSYSGSVKGYGTIFRITTGGALTTLYHFSGKRDGAYPLAGLTQASDGNLYGTTYQGGAYGTHNSGPGYGTIFKITTGGALTTLYSFTGGTDEAYPLAGLIQAKDGDLYGTTSGSYSGGTQGYGTVFRITTGGKLKTLYAFTGGTDGENPSAALIQASDGNLYGTTSGSYPGGENRSGTIFKITTGGKLKTLYAFTGGTDGEYPNGLFQAMDGNLYGTTYEGGDYGLGAIFSVELPFP
jgi:uncharacterized repeat protein (TIGR03803 family)